MHGYSNITLIKTSLKNESYIFFQVVAIIHGGFWKAKYSLNNSAIDSLSPFFVSKVTRASFLLNINYTYDLIWFSFVLFSFVYAHRVIPFAKQNIEEENTKVAGFQAVIWTAQKPLDYFTSQQCMRKKKNKSISIKLFCQAILLGHTLPFGYVVLNLIISPDYHLLLLYVWRLLPQVKDQFECFLKYHIMYFFKHVYYNKI